MSHAATSRVSGAIKHLLQAKVIDWRWPEALLLLDVMVAGSLLVLVSACGFAQAVPPRMGIELLILVFICHAITGQYRRVPAHGVVRPLLQTLAGVILAAGIATKIFGRFGFAPHLFAAFITGHALTHELIRLAGASRREGLIRCTLLGASVIYLFNGYFGRGSLGAGDGYWYSAMVADVVAQWRAGVFPAFVGQTEYAFNGAVFPHRFAPFLQHAAGVLDALTGHQLSSLMLLNLVLVLSAAGGMGSAYFCARRILGGAPWTAAALALLYIASPAVLALAYTGALYMSMTTLPFVPLVLLAVWRAGKLDEPLPVAACVAPVAAAWLCHPPIALWLHVLFAAALIFRWTRQWRTPARVAREAAGVCLLFAMLGGFTFVSALTVGPDGTAGDRTASLGNIIRAFPAVLKRVSLTTDQISDYQLGWSLWILLLAAGIFWLRRRELRAGLLLGCALGMVMLLLPVPGITALIWGHLPQLVINATFYWPMQRLALIFAGIAALAAAATWPRFPTRVTGVAAASLLWLGVIWSHVEAGKFLHRGELMLIPRAAAEKSLTLNNALLTRYAFLRFPAVPSYYSHGFVDPVLEHRLLSLDGTQVLLSNRDAVLLTPPVTTTLQSRFDGVQGVVLKPNLKISPGVRHYFRMEWLAPPLAGSIVSTSPSVTRVYALPDTGDGMDYLTASHAFGQMPGNTDGFPLWVQGDKLEELDLRFMLAVAPKARPPRDYLRVRDYSYRPEQLPIRVHGFAPYRLTLASAEAGLLETPRMFLEGYRATVNGQPAEVRRSADGLVAIPVPAGPAEITLAYPGQPLLRISYWLSLLTWAGLGVRAAMRAGRRCASPRAQAVAA